jgi:hypothetical protein
MRYLKLFEDLESDGYEIEDLNTPNLFVAEEYEIFTERELERFEKIGFIKRRSTVYGPSSLRGKVLEPSVFINRIIQIMSAGDEWYYIRTRRPDERSFTWYKCDQFEGVVKCLEKECDFLI